MRRIGFALQLVQLACMLLVSFGGFAQESIGRKLEWRHAPTVRLDSAGIDYRFSGLEQSYRGAMVWHEATFPVGKANQNADPHIERVQYVPAPFAVDGIPRWLRQEAAPRVQIAQSRGEALVHVRLPAFRLRNGEVEILSEYQIGLRRMRAEEESTPPPHFTAASESVLSSGDWVMLSVKQSGVYKLTYESLQREGFSTPGIVSLWGHEGRQLPYDNRTPHTDDLQQIPLHWVIASGDTPQPGDYALCYLPGSSWWAWDYDRQMFIYHRHEYDAKSHYFLTDSQYPQSVLDGKPQTASQEQTVAWGLAGYIGDKVNLAESGRELFGEAFRSNGERQLGTGIREIHPSGTTRVYARMAADSRRETQFEFYAAGSLVHQMKIAPISAGMADIIKAEVEESVFSFSNAGYDGNLRIALRRATPSTQGWISRISFNTQIRLAWGGESLYFHSDSIRPESSLQSIRIANLPARAEVWDVTDVHAPIRFAGIPPSVPSNQRRAMVAFLPASAVEPTYIGPIANQNLHGMPIPEMLIVSHADFLPMAQEIAQIYGESPLTKLHSEVVEVEQVYREFSSGNRDASAIRNLARMLYWRGGGPNGRFRYLLLVGKALYTLVDAGGDVNYVPNYQSLDSYDKGQSYGTDDFYGLLNPKEGGGEGALDIGIGRYSVFDQATADAVLKHERAYHNPANWGDWVVRSLFLADDGDGNVFTQDAETLAQYIEQASPSSMVTRVHADAFRRKEYWYKNTYPSVTAAVNAQIDRGAFLFNYLGHAHPGIIGHEGFISMDDVQGWRNMSRLPIFVAASCLLARYDIPKGLTIGESMVFSPYGGMIGMIAASRIAYSHSNYNFNEKLTEAMFPLDPALAPRSLGDAYYRGKAKTVNTENKRKYALIGNPALPFPNPNAKAKAVSLYGLALRGVADTVRAGSMVQFEFTLQHADGTPFNGEAFVSMQGPRTTLTTHGNNETLPVSISEHVGTAYRGKVTVHQGSATAQWRIPKDMDCDYQLGKINIVGTSDEGLCVGSYTEFTFGGVDKTPSNDKVGPRIELSLNDRVQRHEWHVNAAPLIVARLQDSSGISLSQLSPLTATLRGPSGEMHLNLNDFYTADKDSYQAGELRYRLARLDTGSYHLTLRAHDTQGNSAQASLTFHVVHAKETKVSHLLNYPNPFIQGTKFYFDTTKPGVPSRVMIQIFTVDGQIVKTLHAFVASPGARMGPFHWDGRDDHGQVLARGVYFYRVRLTPLETDGKEQRYDEQFEKMLKL